MNQERSFWHSGDIGDIIASLPTVRALGGGDFVIGHRPNGQRESLKGGRFEALSPLLLAQPYIHSVRWGDAPVARFDFSHFRNVSGDGMNLANWQARHLGAVISMEPWLTAQPCQKWGGRAVIARSPRYHNRDFPWRKILPALVDPVFVGLPVEHDEFCAEFGWKVERAHTATLLDMARIIAGCRVFVGNQSAPFWIAAGLGVKCIQETWTGGPNSIIHRPGMHYPAFSNYEVDGLLK